MSRRPKGPRLYLRSGRVHARTGQPIPDIYYIRDGSTEISTGCGPESLGRAEQALADFIAAKWTPEGEGGAQRDGDPASVFVAEVLALYLQDRAPGAPDPSAVKARFKPLLTFFAEDTLAHVKRSRCQAYVAWRVLQPIASAKKDMENARRVTEQGARRELEDLSAAIGHWAGEHPLTRRPKVWLPDKPESPRDALTRSQAAALLWASMGWRRQQDGSWKRLGKSARANRAHLRRFILMGLYTGTRPGVIPKLLWTESPTQAWIDLDDGVIYRRGKREKEQRTKKRTMVRIPSRLLAHLRRWKATDDALMARRRAEELPVTNSFLHHGGRPLAGRIRRGYESLVADSGLPSDVTPHWHRHTAATWLMERDAKPWEAASFLGMTMKTLEDNYGHHRPNHQSSAVKAMGGKR
jgi:hypothetical protein